MPTDSNGLSRRALLIGAAAGSAMALVAPGIAFPASESKTPGALPNALQEFGYDQVTIQGERQLAQQQNVRSILLGLDEDSLLKPFREMSGKPGPGASLGGWYGWKADYDPHHDDTGFAPGHCFGQWVSAMARLHASTGDAALGERAIRLNDLLSQSIGEGYFAQTRFPAYTYDKLLCGLMDAHRLLDDPSAFATLDKITAAAQPNLPGHAVDREIQYRLGKDGSWMWDESYTMPENLYLVSGLMSDPAARARYRAMADAYLDDATYFAPLARDQNVMADRHAYSYVNALCSAMQAYLAAGSAMHLDAARNAFAMLEQQSFATGGWGPDELLRKPGADQVARSLGNTHRGFETPCGSYAHMKLTRYLLRATRDGRYGDSMERVLLNTILGALPLQPDGRAFYYADYNVVAQRVYFDNHWPCCSGTLPQVVADYGINTYLYEPAQLLPTGSAASPSRAAASVWVNLYQPSTLRWTEGAAAMQIVQTGDYPDSGDVRLRIKTSQPVQLQIKLRVPAWANGQIQVRLNGASCALGPVMGFVSLDRQWQDGDLVEIQLPMALRLEPLPGHPELVALMCGPVVLFPLRDPGDGANPLRLSTASLLGAERSGTRAWRIKTGLRSQTFVPFIEIGDRTYSTYVNTSLA